jgi:hypothetical protein
VMEVAHTSEILVYYETIWCHIPEGCVPYTRCHENLKSQLSGSFVFSYDSFMCTKLARGVNGKSFPL